MTHVPDLSREFFQQLEESMKAAAALEHSWASQLAREAARTQRMLGEIRRKATDLERFLLDLQWPPPGELSAVLLNRVVEAHRMGGLTAADVDEIFVHHYDEEVLESLLSHWHERGHVPHRIPILESAIRAHIEGLYTLSVPAILPQIEGLLAETFGHGGPIRLKDVGRYLGLVFTSKTALDTATTEFFLATLLDQFRWGQPVPFMSRHAILHGADTAYATAAKSLRVILTFHHIHRAIRYVATDGGACIHRPRCPRLRSAVARRVFGDRDQAAQAGLRPCKVCLP